jgi:hypothetical protein
MNGNKIYGEYKLNQDTTTNESMINPVALSNGNFFAGWGSNKTLKFEIYGNYFNFDTYTTLLAKEIGFALNITGEKFITQSCSLKFQKAFLIIFYLGTSQLYGMIINESNDIIKNPFLINSITTARRINFGHFEVNCFSYSDGKFMILWHDISSNSYGKIYNADYTILKNEFMINTSTINNQIYPIGRISTENNKIMILYQSNHINSSYQNIYAKIFDSDTFTVSKDEFQINDKDLLFPDASNKMPRFAFDNLNNEFLLCWTKSFLLNGSEDIICRYMDINGNFLTPEFYANTTKSSDQNYSFVLNLNNNQNVVSWTSF